MNKKVCLIILDGWGNGDANTGNAVHMAKTPFADFLNEHYPHATLRTDGENVGLPEGQMGNSEVGHINIGAGRVVYQDLVKINVAIRSGEFAANEEIQQAFNYAAEQKKNVHLMGLVSDGGVHSHINHLKALCDIAHQHDAVSTFIHAFTDGRDTDPKSGLEFMREIEQHIAGGSVSIASVCGRYYAMDRDKRWERVKLAHDALVYGKGRVFNSACDVIETAYASGITDEFIEPANISDGHEKPLACIAPDDVVICFNFRTDRCREITEVLTQRDMPEHGMSKLPLYYVTMTNYDDSY
ncbi:MAG: 2,3-bisphosphoglycerate-independent phosphoglycerate mutase, partial [Flavobacteriales bacterium]